MAMYMSPGKAWMLEGSWFSVWFCTMGCHGDSESEKGATVFHSAAVCMIGLLTALAMRAGLAGSQATCENTFTHLHSMFWLWLNGVLLY